MFCFLFKYFWSITNFHTGEITNDEINECRCFFWTYLQRVDHLQAMNVCWRHKSEKGGCETSSHTDTSCEMLDARWSPLINIIASQTASRMKRKKQLHKK